MEPSYGFIHEQFDIKLLILYVLRRLPAEIDSEALGDLVLIDGGINYFDYKVCLSELEDTAQIEQTAAGWHITAKGIRNIEILENGLPYSVRAKAARAAAPVIAEMRRQEMILANHEVTPEGVYVYLAMNDIKGSVFDLKLLATDEGQAVSMERNFKKNAEQYYQQFLHALCEEKRGHD